MSLRPVPKPIKDTSPDPHEVTLKARAGSQGALMKLVNELRGIGKVTQGQVVRRSNGEVDQTLTVAVYDLAKHYEPRPERPYEDKSGDVYIFRSRKTLGLYKIGTSTRTQQRVKEVNRHFDEDFERIHSVHVDDAYALEHALHVKYAAVLKVGTKEQFWLTDTHLEEIYALKGD